MKKIIRLFICVLMLFTVSCAKENDGIAENPTDKPGTDPSTPEEEVIPPSIADSSFYYYNKAYLLTKDGAGHTQLSKDGYTYYRDRLNDNKGWAYFWNQALVIFMVEDRYDCRGDESMKPLIVKLLDAFSEHEKLPGTTVGEYSDWSWNDFQDDLLWAGLAYIRGYLITGEQRFLDQAKWDWNFLYSRGYSDDLGGGLWWSTANDHKSGLSNNPAITMAAYLYKATGNKQYLEQAEGLYNWVYKVLRKDDGSIDENVNKEGKLTGSYNVYNVGAFIEACHAMYLVTEDPKYIESAHKSIEYVMINKVNDQGICSKWHRDGTWQSEFARSMGLFVKYHNLWDYKGLTTKSKRQITYYDWMRMNADAAWNMRNRTYNITCCDWENRTPMTPDNKTTWTAHETVSATIMIQVTPDKNPNSIDK